MLLVINTGKKRNAMTDSFKNIINEFSGKDQIIAIVPVCYDESEFSDGFNTLIRENFSDKSKASSLSGAVKLAFRIRGLIKKNKIRNVFLYFDNDWFNIFINLFLTGRKIRYYVWMHDPVLHSGEGMITKTVRFFNSLFLYKKAEKIFISYQAPKDFAAMNFKINPERIIPIKLPEMKELEFDDLRISEKELKDYKYDIIFYGRIEEYKGIELFIESINYIESRYQISLKVVIAGTGNTENNVRQMLVGKSNFLFLNRYIENRELADLIINSKAVIMPYKDATGTLAIQAANYYNKPVIATKVGCFPEYITDGINGIIVEEYSAEGIAEAIWRLHNDNVLYNRMKKEMGDYFTINFDIRNMVKRLQTELE